MPIDLLRQYYQQFNINSQKQKGSNFRTFFWLIDFPILTLTQTFIDIWKTKNRNSQMKSPTS